jgi:hypothetical protein
MDCPYHQALQPSNARVCYARAPHSPEEAEMSADKLRSVIAEARDLGVSIMMLAAASRSPARKFSTSQPISPRLSFRSSPTAYCSTMR